MLLFLFVYVSICAVCATAGSSKSTGYWGCFFLCFFFTPIIGLIVGLVSPYKKDPKIIVSYKCKHCQYVAQQNSYYCPRCQKDSDGFTVEENKIKYS